MLHPRAAKFGVDMLNKEIRDLCRKRVMFKDLTTLKPAPLPLPSSYSNFPRALEVAYILYDFIHKNGGRIDEGRLNHFFKKYPECKEVVRKYCLKDFCSNDITDGLLVWKVETNPFIAFNASKGSIHCGKVSNQSMIESRVVQIKQKLNEFRKLDAMTCFDAKTKYWLVEESILRDIFSVDFSKIGQKYEKNCRSDHSLLLK